MNLVTPQLRDMLMQSCFFFSFLLWQQSTRNEILIPKEFTFWLCLISCVVSDLYLLPLIRLIWCLVISLLGASNRIGVACGCYIVKQCCCVSVSLASYDQRKGEHSHALVPPQQGRFGSALAIWFWRNLFPFALGWKIIHSFLLSEIVRQSWSENFETMFDHDIDLLINWKLITWKWTNKSDPFCLNRPDEKLYFPFVSGIGCLKQDYCEFLKAHDRN